MIHGIATLKESLLNIEGNVILKEGDSGFVTAYLPEQNTFAVKFSNNQWITFKETEEDFLKRCKFQTVDKEEVYESLDGKSVLKIVHKDKSLIKKPETLEEVIEELRDRFEFVEDKSILEKAIKDIEKSWNKINKNK